MRRRLRKRSNRSTSVCESLYANMVYVFFIAVYILDWGGGGTSRYNDLLLLPTTHAWFFGLKC